MTFLFCHHRCYTKSNLVAACQPWSPEALGPKFASVQRDTGYGPSTGHFLDLQGYLGYQSTKYLGTYFSTFLLQLSIAHVMLETSKLQPLLNILDKKHQGDNFKASYYASPVLSTHNFESINYIHTQVDRSLGWSLAHMYDSLQILYLVDL